MGLEWQSQDHWEKFVSLTDPFRQMNPGQLGRNRAEGLVSRPWIRQWFDTL